MFSCLSGLCFGADGGSNPEKIRSKFLQGELFLKKLVCGQVFCYDSLMTKVFDLGLYEGVYCLQRQREKGGELVDWWQKLLCWEFVKLVSGYSAQWLSIRVTVSTDPISAKDGVARLQVRQEGFYRWSWRWHEADSQYSYFTFFNTSYGMYFAVEDVLRDFFPSEECRDDGMDEWKDLWIRISDPAEGGL